ncbi:TPA: helix-turn-helix transcriptional regulator [Streptococcus suis]
MTNNIKYCRVDCGYTQKELADEIGVTRQSLSDYENGKYRIPKEVLLRIAEVLMVDIVDLLVEW